MPAYEARGASNADLHRSAAHVHAAVDGDGGAGDEACEVAQEEDGCSGNVFRETDSAEDEALGDLFATEDVEAGRCHVGFRPGWRDAVDADVVRAKLARHGAHEHD